MARRMLLPLVIVVLAIAAAGYGALHYMTAVPGKPHRGPLPPLTPEEAMLAQSLARHIATVAAREHNVAHYEELHWAFAEQGFQAVMVTDTAPFRYPHYQRASDTADKVDTEKVARVVKGIERVIRDLSR